MDLALTRGFPRILFKGNPGIGAGLDDTDWRLRSLFMALALALFLPRVVWRPLCAEPQGQAVGRLFSPGDTQSSHSHRCQDGSSMELCRVQCNRLTHF